MATKPNVKTDKYRGWVINYDPPPIPIRDYDWQAYGPGYDAWTADEGDWEDSGEKVAAPTREKLIEAIDEWFEEHPTAIEFDTGEGLGELISAAQGKAAINQYVDDCASGKIKFPEEERISNEHVTYCTKEDAEVIARILDEDAADEYIHTLKMLSRGKESEAESLKKRAAIRRREGSPDDAADLEGSAEQAIYHAQVLLWAAQRAQISAG